MAKLRIATRESPLAMWQAEHVAKLLHENGVATSIVPLVSGGDQNMAPIDGTRQVGVFTKRIQQALVDDEADVAVHSLKDLPTEPDSRFVLAAVPVRETVLDCLVSDQRYDLETLPKKARIGTGSRRRGAQLRSERPDLDILPIRGNVQTRLAKLKNQEYDAIVLAEAGVVRLNMHELPRTLLPLERMLPAPGQGALGIEVRHGDSTAIKAIQKLNHPHSHACVIAERVLLAKLHGGCLAPIAAFATVQDGDSDTSVLELRAVVLSADGAQRLDQHATVSVERDDVSELPRLARELAETVSEQLISAGAVELIQSGRDLS